MAKPVVGILMGSDSDFSVMKQAAEVLKRFKIPCEVRVLSAHRSPDEVTQYVRAAAKRGIKVLIAGAGGAAHLAGVLAAHTTLPVLGVPMQSALNGLDSLLSTVQMPKGVPVATFAVGEPGAANAGVFAVQILSMADNTLQKALQEYKHELAEKVKKGDEKVAQLC